MESHQKKLQSELGNMRRKHHDDREKAAKKRLLLIEKIQRDDETEEKVFEKYLDQKAESERREIEEQQKAEMKQQKHRWNSGAALPGITKEQQKMQLARHHSEQKQKLEVEQRQSHEMELRKYKRKRLTGKQGCRRCFPPDPGGIRAGVVTLLNYEQGYQAGFRTYDLANIDPQSRPWTWYQLDHILGVGKREIDQFDAESLRLGFNSVSIPFRSKTQNFFKNLFRWHKIG